MNLPVLERGAICGVGRGARGLGEAIARWTGPAVAAASEPSEDALAARQRRPMSRAAVLATLAIDECARGLGTADGGAAATGVFFGVGPSSGDFGELRPVIAASFEGERFSLARLGSHGLAACNPLLTFQLLPNFTLCHGAIARGLGGPTAAFYSRGGGTVAALLEAAAALKAGACPRALAGGADSNVHPVTLLELRRDGYLSKGLTPAEGAAALLLGSPDGTETPLAWLQQVVLVPDAVAELESIRMQWLDGPPVDEVVLAAWGPPARAALARAVAGQGRVLDLTAAAGETGAAAPALAWAVAVDRIVTGAAGRVLVVSAGIDGDLGVVRFAAVAS